MGIDVYRDEFQKYTLDELLSQLEIDISRVGQQGVDASLRMLAKMDLVFEKLESMRRKENEVKAESAQFDYIVSSLNKQAGKFLKDVGGAEHLGELRHKSSPKNAQSWWYLDESYQRQVRRNFRQALAVLGALAAGVVLLVILYNRFFAPDPIVAKRYSLELDADQFLGQGNLVMALDAVNQALEIAPQDAGMIILRGVLLDRLGKPTDSATEFSRAQEILQNREIYLLERTESWIKVGALPEGLKDIQACIQEYPQSAQGYFYYGRINELSQNYTKAIDAYTQASALAEKQGKMELNATIRMTMAMLMQSMPAVQATTVGTPQK